MYSLNINDNILMTQILLESLCTLAYTHPYGVYVDVFVKY